MNCSDSQIPCNHFFNQHDSSLGRHVNAASRKSLEIAKRASDVMTQTKLRQTDQNGGRFS